MGRQVNFLLQFVIGILTPGLAVAAPFFLNPFEAHQVGDGQVRLSPKFQYLHSSTNYDRNGRAYFPTGLDHISRSQMDIGADYGLGPRLTLFVNLSWSHFLVQQSSNGGFVFGLGDQTVGAQYKLWTGARGRSFSLQARGDFPAYSNTDALQEGTPVLGDGVLQGSLGGLLDLPFWKSGTKYLGLKLAGAYSHRMEGYSASIPVSVMLNYERSDARGFEASLGTRGLFSLGNDSSTLTRGRIPTGAGGSFLAGAINPSYFALEGEARYKFHNRLALSLMGRGSLAGKNATRGFIVGVGATFMLRGASTREVELSDREKGRTQKIRVGSKPKGFLRHGIEGKVTKVNDRLSLIRINQGSRAGVNKGQSFHIFSTDQNGKIQELVARGRVISVKAGEAAIKVVEFFKETWIEENFIVKQVVR